MYNRRPKSILVALAPGPGALEAAAVHQTLVMGAYAKSIGASLVLYHCVPTVRAPLVAPTWKKLMQDTMSEMERSTQILERIQSHVASAELPVRVVIEPAGEGPIYRSICNAVKEQECDMLCINTHAADKRLVARIGSIANDILLHAEFPVAVLTPNSSAFAYAPETFPYFLDQAPKALVVPVDISLDEERKAINEALVKRALDVASPMRADIDLFCAAHLPEIQFTEFAHSNVEAYMERAQLHRGSVQQEMERLAKFVEDADLRSSVTVEDRETSVGKQICHFASAKGPRDWIVTATRSVGHLSRWAFGSVAHDIAHRSINPTLFIPHQVLLADVAREAELD